VKATARPPRADEPVSLAGSLQADPRRLARMWAMSRAQRVTAARHGQFTLGEMLRWASRLPNEVPLVNGELFFIAARCADANEPNPLSVSATGQPNPKAGHLTNPSSRPERRAL
jgi:hypothetical protein